MIALVLLLFLAMLLLGLPIVSAMGIPALVYILIKGLPISTMAYSIYQALNSFPLLASPLFILMGSLINSFGETEKLFKFAKVLLRHTKGYTAKTNIVVSLIFAGMSGAAIADIGGLGQIEIKAMEDEGFSRDYGAALTAATSMVGPIFPPSIPLVIYAVLAQVSTLGCLMAGMIPAILITITMYFFVSLQIKSKLKPQAAIAGTSLANDRQESLWQVTKDALYVLILIPAIIVSMLMGIFSPSEAGAAAVLYLLIIQVIKGKFSFRLLKGCIMETYKTSAGIFMIIAAASVFSKVLTMERFPEMVSSWFLSFSDSKALILLMINILVLLVGMFMETISALTILTPILLSVTHAIGINPIHLGVILVFNLTIGMLTPPFGVGLFTVAQIAQRPMEKILKELFPLFIPLLIALLLITYIPQLSLWLPSFL